MLRLGLKEDGEEFVLDSTSLTRHCVVFGATGSGKTVLSKSIVEAASLSGVPVLAIDPKGDIGSLALTSKSFDFGSWADGDRAETSLNSSADEIRDNYQNELRESGVSEQDIAKLVDNVEVRIFTPRSGAGIPVSLSPKLEAPAHFESYLVEDPPLAYEMLELTSTTLGKLVGFTDDDKVQLAFIAAILEHYWREGKAVEIRDLVETVRNPPFEKFGELKVEEVFDKKQRAEFITRMNLVLTDPGIKSWFVGEPVDFDKWFQSNGKVPVNVVDLRGIAGEREKQFFVEYLLEQLFFWMIRQKGAQDLKYLLYFDEIHGFCPPVSAPPSKKILIRLIKMARAYGLGMILATQNPSDLDYKVLSNANIRFIGSLPMKQDIERVRLGLDLGPDAFETLSSLRKMEFYCQIFDRNQGFLVHPRWLISYHRGPLEPAEIKTLMRPLKEEWVPNADADASSLKAQLESTVIPDCLKLKIDFDEASQPPLEGPCSLNKLTLRLDPYYVLDFEVNTWKQFQHYQKEVRINGKGKLVVDAVKGKVDSVLAAGTGERLTRIYPEQQEPTHSRIMKTIATGEPFSVTIPDHAKLTIEKIQSSKSPRDVELGSKQQVSDSYAKTVKLVGVRTARQATVKPSPREIRFPTTTLVRHPIWEATFGIDGIDLSFHKVFSAADGTILSEEYPSCSSSLHKITSGKITVTSCGHIACPEHLHSCPKCTTHFCSVCQPVLSCGHVACDEHTTTCTIGKEVLCTLCGENSCGHSTCSTHNRKCENCGDSVCLNCVVEKGVLRKRVACSQKCASLL